MTKTEAKALFGPTWSHMANALGVSLRTITYWHEKLTQQQADQVRGAAMRLGLWK